MQIARDSGGLWYSAICDFYQFLPHFCSLPVMGFNGLTQFTNMDILDKECINNSNLDESKITGTLQAI